MNLQSHTSTGRIFRAREADYAPFELVSELLSLILAGNENEIRVESRDFFCDRRVGIETTSLLSVDISCEDIVETKNKIEITLTGTIDNQQGKRAGFTLYFFMWWNRHAPVLNEGKGFVRSPSDTLDIHFEENTEQLSDAVFDLRLYRKNTSFQSDVLGNGRGFLFVGPDQGIMAD